MFFTQKSILKIQAPSIITAEGHLFFRRFFHRDLILQAKMSLLEHIAENEGVIAPAHPLSDGVLLTEIKAQKRVRENNM
jgi:hypothetical protein